MSAALPRVEAVPYGTHLGIGTRSRSRSARQRQGHDVMTLIRKQCQGAPGTGLGIIGRGLRPPLLLASGLARAVSSAARQVQNGSLPGRAIGARSTFDSTCPLFLPEEAED